MPKRRAQSSSTASGARKQVPELTTVVPPTTFATGTTIGGLPAGDRQPAAAVEEPDRLQLVAGIGVAVEVAPGLQHEHVDAGLGQGRRGDRAARARADDHHVAFLALRPRLGVAEAAGGLGRLPSASSQPIS